MPKQTQYTNRSSFEPVKVYDDLGAYRLLGAVFELPETLDNVTKGHAAALQRDLCIAMMVAASDRLLAMDTEKLEEVASQ
jgi:hypothetical protein